MSIETVGSVATAVAIVVERSKKAQERHERPAATFLTAAQLDALEALHRAATPAPWRSDTRERMGVNWPVGAVLDCGCAEDGDKYSDYIVSTDRIHASEMVSGDAKADSELIAAVRNVLPKLLAAARAVLTKEPAPVRE